ncbi:MAG: bifunctional sulfate adenylyltransferase/adenylylsulfate kinase [Myxococcota bacterium]
MIEPYGGKLVSLLTSDAKDTRGMKRLTLGERALCDLELLATGGFSPLTTFMGKKDYERVCAEMRLADGTLWPMPITLPVSRDVAVKEGEDLALCDAVGNALAVMNVREVYDYDPLAEARAVLGTTDEKHPGVQALGRQGSRYVSGPLTVMQTPGHFDFTDLRMTPKDVRAAIAQRGWTKTVAFQTRNPLHRAHEEITKRAAREIGAGLLLHPVVGVTKPGDVDHYTRVRCYKALAQHHYAAREIVLGLLPLAMRMAGPREALWHALIRRNYGATHFIVGRDHAGPGNDSNGKPFYGPYEAQELAQKYEKELGVGIVPFQMMVYLPNKDTYVPVNEVPKGEPTADISGTQVRDDYLAKGRALPTWFTRPEVAAVLAEASPPKYAQGVTIWLTGLSGAGKSTITHGLEQRLLAVGRDCTFLDGDEIRTHLSKGLGFSKEDRDANIRRVGYVAAQITRHGGTVIAAVISPYKAVRDEVRKSVGNFVEVFVDAPLEVCEARDVKGLYKKARAGELKGFTGIDDPYEAPEKPEVVVRTGEENVRQSVDKIVDALTALGYLKKASDG